MFEECRQIRVIALVVDDEAGVDRYRLGLHRHIHGVAVSTDPTVFLVDRYSMSAVQQPSCRYSRDAGSDNRDALWASISCDKTIHKQIPFGRFETLWKAVSAFVIDTEIRGERITERGN